MCTYVNRMTKFTTYPTFQLNRWFRIVDSLLVNYLKGIFFNRILLFFLLGYLLICWFIPFDHTYVNMRHRNVFPPHNYKVVSFSYFKFFFKFIYYHVLEVALKRLSNIPNITLSRCLKITTRLHKANICRREFLSRKFLISYDLS